VNIFDACFAPDSIAHARRMIQRGETFEWPRSSPTRVYEAAKEMGYKIRSRKINPLLWLVIPLLRIC